MNGGPLWIFAPLGALDPAARPDRARGRCSRGCARPRRRRRLDLAILGWLVAGFTPAYSADRQQLFTIEYVWDEAARTAPLRGQQ